MVHYTVLVPVRDATDAVAGLLPRLDDVLAGLLLPYEILCVDDGSQPSAWQALEDCRGRHARLRLLRFDRPRGTSAALTAGVAAARGELVICLSPEPRFDLQYLAHLISRLGRYDLAVAEPERSLVDHFCAKLQRSWRVLGRGNPVTAGDGLFFAGRREALGRLGLARGAATVLPALVERRGFRVCRVTIAAGLPPCGESYRASLVERLAARWFDRFEPHLASEPASDGAAARPLTARHERARARQAPPAMVLPGEQQSGHSA